MLDNCELREYCAWNIISAMLEKNNIWLASMDFFGKMNGEHATINSNIREKNVKKFEEVNFRDARLMSSVERNTCNGIKIIRNIVVEK